MARQTKFRGDVNVTGNLTVGGTVTKDGEIQDDVTVLTNKKVQFRDNGIYIQSPADGKLKIAADGTGADNITLSGTVTFNALANLAAGFTFPVVARTATAAGDGTGAIASGPMLQFVAVTAGADANAIITLPNPVPGSIVILHVGATGYELRTTDPETVAINGGKAENAESAIGANTTVVAICASATSWKAFQMGADGTLAQVEAAAA